jgi:hypothetical protein
MQIIVRGVSSSRAERERERAQRGKKENCSSKGDDDCRGSSAGAIRILRARWRKIVTVFLS